MKKKILSLFMVIAITIFNFMPTMVRAEDKPVASISRDSKIYLVDIKKDGVSDLKYIYSSDITNDNEIFNSLSQSISSDFATLIPTEFTEGNIGIMSSTKYSSEMNANWSDYDYVINNYYTGEITDRVSDLYYNVNNTFKSNVDTENADLEEHLDFLEDNIYNTTEKAEVFFPIGQHYDYVFQPVGETIQRVRTLVIDYERVTIYYRSANVTTSSTTQYGHNNIWKTGNGKVAVLYENRDAQEQPSLDGETWGNGEVVDYVVGDEITVKAKADDGNKFVGWYVSDVEKGPDYYKNQLVSTNANYTYKPGVTTVSGIDEPINYITAVFEEDNTKEYTISNDIATAIFTFEKNHDFALNMIDLLSINPEDAEEIFGVDVETFNTTLETMKNSAKEYGDVLSIYNILIDDGNIGYTDSVKLKIKLTEAMKKYNTLKLLYLDDANNFKVADVKDLIINSTTADVDLDHLSVYALVGSNTETTTDTSTTSNPQTGDNVMFYISMLGLSIIGLAGAGLYTRKKLFNK